MNLTNHNNNSHLTFYGVVHSAFDSPKNLHLAYEEAVAELELQTKFVVYPYLRICKYKVYTVATQMA